MINVYGISGDRYYINNPIWVRVVTEKQKVVVTIDDSDISFVFYTYNGEVEFDLAEIIKGIMPEPNHPGFNITGMNIPGVTYTSSIGFSDGEYYFNKYVTFVRGGLEKNISNITIPAGTVLKESEKIPVWQGYNSAKYTLNSFGQVIYSNILNQDEIDRRRVIGCSPMFFRFLNTKGGYSYWLFERWEKTKKTNNIDRVKRRGYHLDLGVEIEDSIKVSTRVDADYLTTMDALLLSPVVHVYNLYGEKLEPGTKKTTTTWDRVYNSGNTKVYDSAEDIYEYSFKFDILTDYNPAIIW